MFEQRQPSRVARIATSTYPRVAKSVESLEVDRNWFDGTNESIGLRQERVSQVIRQVRELMANSLHEEDVHFAQMSTWLSTLEAEKNSLEDVGREFIEAGYQEQIQGLPQYSAMAAGGHRPRLGESYCQPTTHRASTVPSRSFGKDWDRFVAVEPHYFVQKNANALTSSSEMRIRAVDRIVEATHGVSDEVLRAQIVDKFVFSVERERRNSVLQSQRNKTASIVEMDLDDVSDELLFR
jgi:hypothetical protein